MEEKQFNLNELIKLESLPVIFYQLETIGKEIDKKLADLDKLEVSEENKAEVKKRRTEINNLNTLMEEKRKDIKKAILADYEVFNEKYEKEVKIKLQNASALLSEKINTIENTQKQIGIENVKAWCREYCEFLHIDVDFEKLGLNITLTGLGKNLDGKKYKDEAKLKLDAIANDLKLIELEEYSSEILYEYNQVMDFARAKLIVVNRHQEMERIKKEQEAKSAVEEKEEEIVKVVEEIVAPVEVVEEHVEEEKITLSFTVTATKTQLKKLKAFLISEGIEYEENKI